MSSSFHWISLDPDATDLRSLLLQTGTSIFKQSDTFGSRTVCEVFHWPDDGSMARVTEADLNALQPNTAEWKRVYLLLSSAGATSEVLDQVNSPVIRVFYPYKRTNSVWVGGSLHLPPPRSIKEFKALQKAARELKKWFTQFPVVFSKVGKHKLIPFDPHSYYLFGYQNYDLSLYAIPPADDAIQSGTIFVSDDFTDSQFDKLRKQLLLRGVDT